MYNAKKGGNNTSFPYNMLTFLLKKVDILGKLRSIPFTPSQKKQQKNLVFLPLILCFGWGMKCGLTNKFFIIRKKYFIQELFLIVALAKKYIFYFYNYIL